MALTPVSMAFLSDGKNPLPLQDPRQLAAEAARHGMPTDWVGSANRFRLTRGMLPGRGAVLMFHKDLDTIDLDSTSHALRFEDGTTKIEIGDLVVIIAEAILPVGEVLPETPYIVYLADKRWLGKLSVVTDQYNVVSPDGSTAYPDKLGDTSATAFTWQEMVDDIWPRLPEAMKNKNAAAPTFTGPATNPNQYYFTGVSAWEAVNKIVQDLSQTFVLGKDGTFKIVELGATDTKVKETLDKFKARQLDTSLPITGNTAHIPENISVYFHARRWQFQDGSANSQPTAQDFWLTNNHYVKDIATNVAGAQKDSKIAMWASLEAHHDENGDFLNQSALDTHAQTLADDYVAGLKAQKETEHRIYTGLIDIEPDADLSSVDWFDIGGGLQTEVALSVRNYPQPTSLSATRPRYGPGFSLDGSGLGGFKAIGAPGATEEMIPDLRRPNEPVNRWIWGEAKVAIAASDGTQYFSGLVKVFAFETAAGKTTTVDSGLEVTAFNMTPFDVSIGDKIRVIFNWQLRKYVIANVVPTAESACPFGFQANLSTNFALSGAAATVDFDTEEALTTGSIWTLSTAGATEGELTIDQSGLYYMSCQIIGQAPSSTATVNAVQSFMEVDPGGGFVDVTESNRIDPGGTTLTDKWFNSIAMLVDVTSGDIYRIRSLRSGGADAINLLATTGGNLKLGCKWTWFQICKAVNTQAY